jgi:hypothetical protein
MRPLLQKALAISVAAAAATLLWPADDATLVPATRRGATRDAGGASAATPAPAASSAPRGGQAPVGPASGATSSGPTASGLHTRAGDWPDPEPAALAAWQGPRAAPVQRATTTAASATASATAGASAASAAPPFPYHWIGELDDGAAPQVLLASPQRSVGVRLGTTLEGRWRLQRSANGVLLAADLRTGALLPVRGAPSSAKP